MKEVVEYIKSKWKDTIREPDFGLPYPFSSPSADGIFKDMFYWDTYFTNVGLLIDGHDDQVYNNLRDVVWYVNKFGYMPNASGITNRSQPPFFSRMIVDYYNFKKDKNIINEFLPALLKEYDFWMTRRIDKFGLNVYKTDENVTDEDIMDHYKGLSGRVQEYSDDYETQMTLGRDLIAIAESGFDFNMRFKTSYSNIAIHDFIQIDINCLMFDVENNISYLYKELGDLENSKKYAGIAAKRRDLINKYMLDKDGIYKDYNYVDNKFSYLVSCASLYPYIFGVSNDKEGCKKVFDKLEYEYGVSVCPEREDAGIMQWDFPAMWGESCYLTYIGLMNVGLYEEAKRTKEKYISVIDKNFIKYHKLFEKYDVRNGEVLNLEYASTEMMGWTASTYRFFTKED